MPTDLTFFYATSSATSLDCARICAEAAQQHGFAGRITHVSALSPEELLAGGTLIFLLGASESGELPEDVIPFWLYLNSLNSGALRNLHFAVYALGHNNHEQFCAFGNACNVKLSQLGATRLYPMITCDGESESPLQEWIEAVLAKLPSSRSSRWEALAA